MPTPEPVNLPSGFAGADLSTDGLSALGRQASSSSQTRSDLSGTQPSPQYPPEVRARPEASRAPAFEDSSLLKELYTVLENQIFFGDRRSGGLFLSLANPGFPINPEAKEEDPSNFDLFIQSQIADARIESSWVYSTKLGSVSDKYFDIIDNAELPQVSLSVAEQAEVSQLTAWLTDPTNKDSYDNLSLRPRAGGTR